MDAQKIIEELLKILAKKNGAEIKIKKIIKKEVVAKWQS